MSAAPPLRANCWKKSTDVSTHTPEILVFVCLSILNQINEQCLKIAKKYIANPTLNRVFEMYINWAKNEWVKTKWVNTQWVKIQWVKTQ